ncbi:hypothetical protein STEG23_006335 [Scotinomys teguina]
MVDGPGYSMSGVAASLLFILLTVKHPDEFRVVGPALPVLARVGEDALLTCQLLPKRTTAHMEVRWYRSDPDTPVIVHRDGAEVSGLQMEEYRGRAEWTEDGADEGSVALKIRQVQPGDDGQYWCRFQDGDYWREASVLLQVVALGSSPNIHVKGPGDGGVQLVCTSQGWFPEPEVHWEGTGGEKLLSVSENHVPGEDGLLFVEDTLVVRNDTSETISCFIYNHGLKEAKEATIALPEKLQSELASSRVIGPSQPIFVQVGGNIEFTCHLLPQTDAQSMEVRWVRSHYYPAVHVYVGGAHSAEEQMVEYRGRTVVMSDAIHEGNLTLRIHDARPSDHGQYWCLFGKDGVYQEARVDVQVMAVGSTPLITREALKDGGMQLKCASDGWFPRPHVQWRDREGRAIPSFSEAFHQGSQGLFQVETLLLVTNSSVVNVTCSISLAGGEEKVARFPLSDSRIALLWMILPVLVLPLAMAIDLIKVKHRPKEVSQFSVRGPTEPITVLLGTDATLPCQLSPIQSASRMHIRWYRAQLTPAVLVFHDGQEQEDVQIPEYRGRTQMVTDAITTGSVALQIQQVQASDEGLYHCQVTYGFTSQEATIELHVIDWRKELYREDWKKALLYPDWRKELFQLAPIKMNHEVPHQDKSGPKTEESRREETADPSLGNPQVDHNIITLYQEGFMLGRYYWEVDVGDTEEWTLGVYELYTQDAPPRDSVKKFRVLEKKGDKYRALTFCSQNVSLEEALLLDTRPLKIAIFLDQEDNDLSFYNMTDETHIFSFAQASFWGSPYPYFKRDCVDLSPSQSQEI